MHFYKYILLVGSFVLWLNPVHVQSQVFKDTTLNLEEPSGLVIKSGSGTKGIAVADYNNDGFLDILFVVRDQTKDGDISSWNRLFQFNGTTYTDKTSLAGKGVQGFTQLVNSEYHYKLGASWGDYNNDGYPDLFLANSGKDILLRNDHDGTFTNITDKAGVAGSATVVTSQGLWFDYDLDGDLDLYVSVQRDQDANSDNTYNKMYENLGDDEFLNVSIESGLNDPKPTWTTLAVDADLDGDLDLYLANDFGPNSFYLNNGDKTFTEQTEEFNLTDIANGMGLSIGDPDQNGLFDFYLTNITEFDDQAINHNRLFINTGEGSFIKKEFDARVSEAGWGWGNEFFDFDNDTDEDLIVANGYSFESGKQINRLFKNKKAQLDTLLFQSFDDSSGFTIPTESFVNTIFDQDNDGYLDVLTSNTYRKPLFFLNTSSGYNWIKIWLEGVQTNRNGFGSVVEIQAGGKQYYRYYHGAGLFTQNILPVHFGLGNIENIDKLTVHWLNGHSDELENIPTNQTIRIKEFEGLVTVSSEPELNAIPADLTLNGNYPNPFNGTTKITFSLSRNSLIELYIYNSVGQKIYSYSSVLGAGHQQYSWNPGGISSGVYFYRLSVPGEISKTGRMLYLK